MLEAAKVDGATWWQRLYKVILPNMKAAIMVAVLFRALDAFRILIGKSKRRIDTMAAPQQRARHVHQRHVGADARHRQYQRDAQRTIVGQQRDALARRGTLVAQARRQHRDRVP